MENDEHIIYLNCPHFVFGRADQWGESGYLLYDGKVFWYEEDRKDQCSSVRSPMSVTDFIAYAEEQSINIPEEFYIKLQETVQ